MVFYTGSSWRLGGTHCEYTRHAGDVTVVDVAGKITLGDDGALHKNILLNVRNVSYIDSSGMGEIGFRLFHGDQPGRDAKVILLYLIK